MQSRMIAFVSAALLLVFINSVVMPKLFPPPPAPAAKVQDKVEKPAKDAVAGDKPPPALAAAEPAADAPASDEPEPDEQFVTLGSLDPHSDYRMLVTLTNRGAAVLRSELNSPRYRDNEDWEHLGGYLLPIVAEIRPAGGCRVPVAGAGTPAAAAGLQSGDIIVELNAHPTPTPEAYHQALSDTKPGQDVLVTFERDGKLRQVTATLGFRPLELIQPEANDPLSFLLTIDHLDNERIPADKQELPGVAMRKRNWRLLPQQSPDTAAFAYTLPERGLTITKTYRLAKVVGDDNGADAKSEAYHLEFSIQIDADAGAADTKLAYRLDGPTGLPLEGFWYTSKISPNWGGAGVRDVVTYTPPDHYGLVSASTIAGQELLEAPAQTDNIWQGQPDEPLIYTGVDAQYFAAVIMPQDDDPQQTRFAKWMPIRVGDVPDKHKNLTDVTCRIVSADLTLAAGQSVRHDFHIFMGPKKPDLLASYGLSRLVYYGWFGVVARAMLAVLHFFYSVIPNYGVAIILLTVLVRSLMFPISRKQALNAQKMQELQPEIKRIAEKYKGNMEARTKAQQDLFRKHNYNPLAGCLPMFMQLPIFIGLYRSLAVDIELRQAPLISESVRWCSNLGAPDMLWYWRPYLPDFLGSPYGGFLNLGPYLNILPLFTIALFIWQQKMFMPPAADEQAAMQQKMMQYMMIFIGIMFFKVPSGLCLYFIASSLWGIAERKLLPKTMPVTTKAGELAFASPSDNGGGTRPESKKKQRDRR